MNRTGLVIALAIALVTGIVFGVWPQLDIELAALFYDPATRSFSAYNSDWVIHARDAATLLISVLAAPAFFAVFGKLVVPGRRMLIAGRAALFLIATLALGPGLLANVILKDHWARMRPVDVPQLGGHERFTPGGTRAGRARTIARSSPASRPARSGRWRRPRWRRRNGGRSPMPARSCSAPPWACCAWPAAGTSSPTCVFAGVFMFLVIWTAHGLIYRWRPTRLTDDAVERPLERAGRGLREAWTALARRLRGEPGKARDRFGSARAPVC